MKKCPFCAEQIQDEAVKCPYCREPLMFSAKNGIKHGLLISLVLLVVAGSIFLFPKEYQRQPAAEKETPKKAADILPATLIKPSPRSKIEIYLETYPAYFGLTSGNQTNLGKYWYRNNVAYPRKTFYFDTLEELEEQKLKFTTSPSGNPSLQS